MTKARKEKLQNRILAEFHQAWPYDHCPDRIRLDWSGKIIVAFDEMFGKPEANDGQ